MENYLKINTNALRKAKIVYNFGLSECTRVNPITSFYLAHCNNYTKMSVMFI